MMGQPAIRLVMAGNYGISHARARIFIQPAQITETISLLTRVISKGCSVSQSKMDQEDGPPKNAGTSDKLKPYFNDLSSQRLYFRFRRTSLVCIDIEKGNRQWRGGRYGGEIILLDDQDLLLYFRKRVSCSGRGESKSVSGNSRGSRNKGQDMEPSCAVWKCSGSQK